MSLPASSPQPLDEETFYTRCRAAYLAVFKSSLTNILSKQQLCRGELLLKSHYTAYTSPDLSWVSKVLGDLGVSLLVRLLVSLLLPSNSLTFKTPATPVLQLAGRNPSHKTLSKYWTPATSSLNFDDFCEILKSEKQTDENELLRVFKAMDVNGDGFVSHGELEKALTTVSRPRHLHTGSCVSHW